MIYKVKCLFQIKKIHSFKKLIHFQGKWKKITRVIDINMKIKIQHKKKQSNSTHNRRTYRPYNVVGLSFTIIRPRVQLDSK